MVLLRTLWQCLYLPNFQIFPGFLSSVLLVVPESTNIFNSTPHIDNLEWTSLLILKVVNELDPYLQVILLVLIEPQIFWFGFADSSKMIFSYTLPTSLTSSKAFWISTQVLTGPTTIAMFFLFVSFTLLFAIRSARFFMNPIWIFCTLLTHTDMRCSAPSYCSGSSNM